LLVGYKDQIQDLLGRSKRKISGVWVGRSFDVEVPGLLQYQMKLEYKLRCEINQTGKRITGDIWIEADRVSRIDVKGHFKDTDYIFVNYKNKDKNTADYGYGVFRLMGTGDVIKGFFIGRRMREEGIVIAYVEVTKDRMPVQTTA
jgi:hypothetical protein